jgi:hypothetical protein
MFGGDFDDSSTIEYRVENSDRQISNTPKNRVIRYEQTTSNC